MIDRVNTLFNRFELASFSEATLRVEPEPLASPADALGRLKEFAPREGWICCNDKVFAAMPGGVRAASSEAFTLDTSFDWNDMAGRFLLSAELVRGETSIHLRQQGRGWILFRYTESPGNEHWFAEEAFTSPRTPDLVYRTYWRLAARDGRPVRERWACRFTGFRKGGK
jgi:hypothetical protein